jgi:CRISPR/Cas system-associated protein endoribonuclease Cas2
MSITNSEQKDIRLLVTFELDQSIKKSKKESSSGANFPMLQMYPCKQMSSVKEILKALNQFLPDKSTMVCKQITLNTDKGVFNIDENFKANACFKDMDPVRVFVFPSAPNAKSQETKNT